MKAVGLTRDLANAGEGDVRLDVPRPRLGELPLATLGLAGTAWAGLTLRRTSLRWAADNRIRRSSRGAHQFSYSFLLVLREQQGSTMSGPGDDR